MIRRAAREDLAALASLETEVFGAEGWSMVQLEAPLGDPDTLVLCGGGSPPAGCAILRIVADEVELLRVGVRPAARRGGLGRALLAEGLAWARTRRATRCFLEVERANVAALGLYLRAGFAEVGVRRGYYGARRDALLLALEIGAGR
ncbi:MAG: GNAT family N-acetyltransferase [Pseudomonadota bacterium]